MEFKVYSIPGCPQCKILKMKMDAAKIEYEHEESEEAIAALNKKGAPVLVHGDNITVGPAAIKYFNNWLKEHANGN